MQRLALWLALAALAACHGKPAPGATSGTPAQHAPGGGFASEDDVGKAYVEVITTGDLIAAKALFPSHDQLAAVIPCPNHAAVDKPIYTSAFVAGIAEKHHYQVDWVGTDTSYGAAHTFARGSQFDNCTITDQLTFRIVGIKYRDHTAGPAHDDAQRAELVRIGVGGWYLFSF